MSSYRSAVMGQWDSGKWLMQNIRTFSKSKGPITRVSELGTLIRYGLWCGRMAGRVTKVNVQHLVDEWVKAVVGMCTAHDKDDFDAYDAMSDKLMTPILTAPIKQVREFYELLGKTLRETKEVPMLVWMGFDVWGEALVKNASDDDVLKLKNKLAKDIAELVEMDVRDQIPQAIQRALRWRDNETLQQVKEALEGGAKPKLVGRQSCLFLEVGRGKKKKQVML